MSDLKYVGEDMPLPVLRKMAKESGRSLEDAEKYWDDAKEAALDQGFTEGDDDFYAYVMGIVKRRLNLSGVNASTLMRARMRLMARRKRYGMDVFKVNACFIINVSRKT